MKLAIMCSLSLKAQYISEFRSFGILRYIPIPIFISVIFIFMNFRMLELIGIRQNQNFQSNLQPYCEQIMT